MTGGVSATPTCTGRYRFWFGLAPVLVVRLATLMSSTAHDRLRELVGEMEHVKILRRIPELWSLPSEIVATALCEPPQTRRVARPLRAVACNGSNVWITMTGASMAACRMVETD